MDNSESDTKRKNGEVEVDLQKKQSNVVGQIKDNFGADNKEKIHSFYELGKHHAMIRPYEFKSEDTWSVDDLTEYHSGFSAGKVARKKIYEQRNITSKKQDKKNAFWSIVKDVGFLFTVGAGIFVTYKLVRAGLSKK